MNLVLPNNYVELEQEEMMYVDGEVSVDTGGMVDALFLVYGGSIGSWIAYAADYDDKWVGSSVLDGYIFT